jgi:hypothetical protein
LNCVAGLSDYQIRDLNDEINKLMREKSHWDDQIKKLGGPDYKVIYVSIIMFYINFLEIYLDLDFYNNLLESGSKNVGPRRQRSAGK